MKSRTAKPFHTTNLVVVVANNAFHEPKESNFVANGEALLVDPGCSSQFHGDVRNFCLLS